MTTTFKVGDRVVATGYTRSSRVGRIARAFINSYGTQCYQLEDGGIFGADELELI